MSDPFRDEGTATLERAEALAAENEELRARLAELADGDIGKLADESATLARELAEAENDVLVERMQLKTLEEQRRDPGPRSFRWVGALAIAAFVAGITIGTWLGGAMR